MDNILLSITIPTYNRATFVKANLEQLTNELKNVDEGLIEILISDNCSQDNTQDVVESFISKGLKLSYIRNEENKGWGYNFFQCANKAKGRYVLILSDDDLLYDGSLALILNKLAEKEYGVICLRAYGFDTDFHSEYPGEGGSEVEFTDFNQYLRRVMPQITLLSSSIFNKSLLSSVDTSSITPGNFAHLHLILRSASYAENNLFINRFLIASKRDNSSSYIYSEIFVKELFGLLENYKNLGITIDTIKFIERKLLFTYYPGDILRLRLSNNEEYKIAYRDFSERFSKNPVYKFWVAPSLFLPKIFAIPWCLLTVVVGKAFNGDLKVVILFLLRRLKVSNN